MHAKVFTHHGRQGSRPRAQPHEVQPDANTTHHQSLAPVERKIFSMALNLASRRGGPHRSVPSHDGVPAATEAHSPGQYRTATSMQAVWVMFSMRAWCSRPTPGKSVAMATEAQNVL